MRIFLILFFNILLSWSLTKFLIKPFKKIIPDIPNQRSSHKEVKPRGGGLAFILSNLLLSNIFNQINFVFLFPLSIVGFLDDFLNISRWFRFLIQISTSFFILYKSSYFKLILTTNDFKIEFFLVILFVFLCTGIINFCNFIDGIDGILSGSVLTFCLFSTFILSESIWGIIGSLIGFLFWNWQPSKIFMGDIGSNFLGGVIIWILLNTNNINISIGLLLILSPILVDPFICLLRRFFNRENILIAHNMHLYQRLSKGGLSHSNVALIYILSTFFIGITFFIGGLKFEIFSLIVVLLLGFWLENNYAEPYRKGS